VDAARSGDETFQTYVQRADDVYRNAKLIAADRQMIPIPGAGFPATVRTAGRKALAGRSRNVQELAISWASLDSSSVFDLDRQDGGIILNSRYRRRITGQTRRTRTDAPVVKTLMFMLLRDFVLRERLKTATKAEIAEINMVLLAAVKAVADGD
jgi:hypothetical protein